MTSSHRPTTASIILRHGPQSYSTSSIYGDNVSQFAIYIQYHSVLPGGIRTILIQLISTLVSIYQRSLLHGLTAECLLGVHLKKYFGKYVVVYDQVEIKGKGSWIIRII